MTTSQERPLQSTTLSSASTTEILPPKCFNGGVPVGDRCDCPSPFTEPFCKEAKNEVVVGMITATINVFVKVIKKEFIAGMASLGSPAFRIFETQFKEQMRIFYANISGFQGVNVLRLSNGSINVEHQVLLWVPFSEFNASYDKAVGKIRTQLQSKDNVCTSKDKDKLCFNSSDSVVTEVALSPQDLSKACRNNSVVREDLQLYYLARNISNQLQCVSNCSFSHPDPFRCDKGSCYIQTDGPNCYCQQSDAYWYSGRHCDQSISKVGVAVGVALGLAVLLLLILVLAALLCWRHCRPWKEHRRLNVNPNEEKWYENESDWVARPQGLPPQSPRAQQQGPAVYASTSREDAGPTPTQGTFRPQLDQVDTSLQTRIARPRITRL
ncbi:flocculation protein FLO11-like [Crotalus adamanteus]|uniref:Flocculation protein FLO11-like n=1 Tax=Crotalus adamanteus TaxID=8729 RepID=A0AAW1B9S6_CROAD